MAASPRSSARPYRRTAIRIFKILLIAGVAAMWMISRALGSAALALTPQVEEALREVLYLLLSTPEYQLG